MLLAHILKLSFILCIHKYWGMQLSTPKAIYSSLVLNLCTTLSIAYIMAVS